MMRLAAFIMAGRWQAVLAVVGFAVLALILPPLALFSGAALVLVTLRLGAGAGGSVFGLSVAVMILLAGLAAGRPLGGLAYGILQWLPLLVLALVLRHTVSLGHSLQFLSVLGLLAVLGIHAVTPDVETQWRALLEEHLRPLLVQAGMPEDSLEASLRQAARLATGGFVAATTLSLALMLLLGRWWQALLYNPGGFRKEFTGLRLGPSAAVAGAVLVIVALLSETSMLIELSLVAGVMFFLQGIALLHALSGLTANPWPWLVGGYALLVLALPQMMAGLAAFGLVDNFADFRTRLEAKGQNKK